MVAGSVVALAIRRSAVSSVIVIGTHSRAWSDAWISTPGLLPVRLPMRSARISYGPRGTSPAGAPVRFWSRKSVSATGAVVAATTPVPALVRYGCARSIRPCEPASIAAATCAAVLESAPVAFVPSRTRTALPVTWTVSGRLLPVWATNSTVTSLPPSWPQAAVLTTTAD